MSEWPFPTGRHESDEEFYFRSKLLEDIAHQVLEEVGNQIWEHMKKCGVPAPEDFMHLGYV